MIRVEILIRGKVGYLHLQQVIEASGDVVGAADLRQSHNGGFECDDVCACVSHQPYTDKDAEATTDCCGIYERLVTPNDSRIHESPHTTQARRWGQPDTLCELGITDASVRVKHRQDSCVNLVHGSRLLRSRSLLSTDIAPLGSILLPILRSHVLQESCSGTLASSNHHVAEGHPYGRHQHGSDSRRP